MKILLTITLVTLILSTYAQIGVNTDNSAPLNSAMLDVKSTTKAFYPPRMNSTQKGAIMSPQAGAVVFDITQNQLSYYNGTSWVSVSGSGLTLPYNQSFNQFTGYDGGLFKVTNTNPSGEAVALNGTITGIDGFAIRAMATNTNGFNTGAIYATNSSTNGNGFGLYSSHNGGGQGIIGYSNSGIGIAGSSTSGIGINAVGGSYGLKAEASNVTGYGVFGKTTGTYGAGVRGESSTNYTSAISAYNSATTGGSGVYAFSDNGVGVEARSFNGIGLIASSTNNYALLTTGGNVGIGTPTPASKMDIKGSAYLSHFYFGANEDTYIRGGKAGSKVLINDIAGQGSVGIGIQNPNQYLDVNGRMRLYHRGPPTGSDALSAGIWMNNSTNGLGGIDGAFYGIKTDTEAGIFIGGNWRFWVNNLGNVTATGELGANGGLSVGAGTKVTKIIRDTQSYDLPIIAGGSSQGTIFVVTGVALGDQVLVSGSADMGYATIGSAYVSGVDNVYVRFINTINTQIDTPLMNYHFTIIR